MLSCHEATRLLSQAQEQPLARGERLALGVHVMLCQGCRNFGRQLHVLRRLARACAQGAADELASSPAQQSKGQDEPKA